MCKSIPGTQKHMTMDHRIMIEKSLDLGASLRSIALQLGKDPTTISKEIKKRRIFQEHNHFNEAKNKCALVKDCKKKNICGTYAPVCKRMCKLCNHCNSHCDDFTPRSYHCIVMTLLPAAIIAKNWIKPLLSVIPATRKVAVDWTKPITGPQTLTGNIGHFWLNPEPESIFPRKI